MSARRVRKKRERLMSRRRLNAVPAGGKLIPTVEPTREGAAIPAALRAPAPSAV